MRRRTRPWPHPSRAPGPGDLWGPEDDDPDDECVETDGCEECGDCGHIPVVSVVSYRVDHGVLPSWRERRLCLPCRESLWCGCCAEYVEGEEVTDGACATCRRELLELGEVVP